MDGFHIPQHSQQMAICGAETGQSNVEQDPTQFQFNLIKICENGILFTRGAIEVMCDIQIQIHK